MVSNRARNNAPALLRLHLVETGCFWPGPVLGRPLQPARGCSGLAALAQAKIPPAIRKFILATGLANGLSTINSSLDPTVD